MCSPFTEYRQQLEQEKDSEGRGREEKKRQGKKKMGEDGKGTGVRGDKRRGEKKERRESVALTLDSGTSFQIKPRLIKNG